MNKDDDNTVDKERLKKDLGEIIKTISPSKPPFKKPEQIKRPSNYEWSAK